MANSKQTKATLNASAAKIADTTPKAGSNSGAALKALAAKLAAYGVENVGSSDKAEKAQLNAAIAFGEARQPGGILADMDKAEFWAVRQYKPTLGEGSVKTLASQFNGFALAYGTSYSMLDKPENRNGESTFRAAIKLNGAVKRATKGQKAGEKKLPAITAAFVADAVTYKKPEPNAPTDAKGKKDLADRKATKAFNALVKALASFNASIIKSAPIAGMGRRQEKILRDILAVIDASVEA